MHSDHQSHMPRTRCGTAQQGPAVPGGLGITSWTSSSAARLSLIHQMLFLLLSSPVGLNFPPPGALWSGQGLERPGGGGRVSFKITQGVDSSLAVVLWKGLACPNRSVLCPWPSAAGSSAVVEPAVGTLVVDEPYGIRKDQRCTANPSIPCRFPNSTAALGLAAKPWRAEDGRGDLWRSLST